MSGDAATEAPRKLQARAVATRRRLLKATIECMVELGHSRTTTTEVCRRAGVSQGALYKHFATKQDLLGATVEHLFLDLIEGYRSALSDAVQAHEDRIAAALELLWATFRAPALMAAFELYTAARTDPELREALRPVLEQHRANLRDEARRLFPEAAATNPRFDDAVAGILSTLQGAAMMEMALPSPDAGRAELAFLDAVARRELEPEAPR
ncbi:MAG: TetR family transcriptional regulator [Sandaracinaceae bacterium]|nr:TetR family transcriptional regulator [Sandaracinaceae bacterium]